MRNNINIDSQLDPQGNRSYHVKGLMPSSLPGYPMQVTILPAASVCPDGTKK